jgi:hypothetical protein
LDVGAEALFVAGMVALAGYLLWQQRVLLLVNLLLLLAILGIAQWLLRPFRWLVPSWLGWLVLLRFLKKP